MRVFTVGLAISVLVMTGCKEQEESVLSVRGDVEVEPGDSIGKGVVVASEDGTVVTWAPIDDLGWFDLDLDAGDWELRFFVDGYRCKWRQITIDDESVFMGVVMEADPFTADDPTVDGKIVPVLDDLIQFEVEVGDRDNRLPMYVAALDETTTAAFPLTLTPPDGNPNGLYVGLDFLEHDAAGAPFYVVAADYACNAAPIYRLMLPEDLR